MHIRALLFVALGILFTLGVLALTYKVEIDTLREVLIIAVFCQTVLALPFARFISKFMASGDIHKIRSFILNLCNGEYNGLLEVPNEREEEDELTKIKRHLNMLARILANYKRKSTELYQQERQRSDRYRDMANIDPLTRIPNRRGFDNELQRRTTNLLETQKPFYLLLIDIDDFKDVNDLHGHHAGDSILVFMGKILRENVRTNDYPFRLGGDEFGVFLDDCPLKNAYDIAQRIQDKFAQNRFGTSTSIGGQKFTLKTQKKAMRQALKLADIALYKAKGHKKNPAQDKRPVIN